MTIQQRHDNETLKTSGGSFTERRLHGTTCNCKISLFDDGSKEESSPLPSLWSPSLLSSLSTRRLNTRRRSFSIIQLIFTIVFGLFIILSSSISQVKLQRSPFLFRWQTSLRASYSRYKSSSSSSSISFFVHGFVNLSPLPSSSSFHLSIEQNNFGRFKCNNNLHYHHHHNGWLLSSSSSSSSPSLSSSPSSLRSSMLLFGSKRPYFVPIPPWRGPRQLLSIGPWGKIYDVTKSKIKAKIIRRLKKKGNAADKHDENSGKVLFLSSSPSSSSSYDGKNNSNDHNGHTNKNLIYKQVMTIDKLPPCPPNHRRIVAISDTHGKHGSYTPTRSKTKIISNHKNNDNYIPSCDILCHAGDILQRYGYLGDLGGGQREFIDFIKWMTNPALVGAKHVVFVGGNHDKLLEEWGEVRVRKFIQRHRYRPKQKSKRRNDASCIDNTINDNGPSVHYLKDDAIEVAGLTIYGSPWSPRGNTGNTAFQQEQPTLMIDTKRKMKALQQTTKEKKQTNVDVLITHSTGSIWEESITSTKTFATRTRATTTTSTSTKSTTVEPSTSDAIILSTAKLWLHGHWHDAYGTIRQIPRKEQKYIGTSERSRNDEATTLIGKSFDTKKGRNAYCLSVNVAMNDMIYRPKHLPVVIDVPVQKNEQHQEEG